MAIITQDPIFKQSVIKSSLRNGISYAARTYKTTRQWIYYWLQRYDGKTWEVVANQLFLGYHNLYNDRNVKGAEYLFGTSSIGMESDEYNHNNIRSEIIFVQIRWQQIIMHWGATILIIIV